MIVRGGWCFLMLHHFLYLEVCANDYCVRGRHDTVDAAMRCGCKVS